MMVVNDNDGLGWWEMIVVMMLDHYEDCHDNGSQ